MKYRKQAHRFLHACLLRERIRGPVLEVGAGKDCFTRKLFSEKYKVVTGNIYPQNIVAHVFSVTALPFKDNTFGCVICEHVLEHVEEPSKALDEIRRVLKPQGLLILVAPLVWPLHQKPYDLWRFSEEGIRHLCAGRFEMLRLESIGISPRPTLICATTRKPLKQEKPRHPKVSIIMPTYNRARIIPRAIKSILRQTFKDWELIIVSDGSIDQTKEAVMRFNDSRVVFVQKTHEGASAARNYALRRARGEYIAYCDDDDSMMPYYLQALSGYLDRHPEIGMVRGRGMIRNESKTRGFFMTGYLWASMHRRSHVPKVGFFDTRIHIGEDIDFLLRYADHYPVTELSVVVSEYLRHKKSITIVERSRLHQDKELLHCKRIIKMRAAISHKKNYFLALAYLLNERGLIKTLLQLARQFRARYTCAESAYLLGLAYFKNGKMIKARNVFKEVLQYPSISSSHGFNSAVMLKMFARAFIVSRPPVLINEHESCRGASYETIFRENCREEIDALDDMLLRKESSLVLGLFGSVSQRSVICYGKGKSAFSSRAYQKAMVFLNKVVKEGNVYLAFRAYYLLAEIASVMNKKIASRHYLLKAGHLYGVIWAIPLLNKNCFKNIRDSEFSTILKSVFILDSVGKKRII